MSPPAHPRVAADPAPADRPAPSPDECTRAWEHLLHDENVFNDRLNFFLLAEAMLLVFHAEVIGKVSGAGLLAIGSLGVVITVLWLVINARQIADFEDAKAKAASYLADYGTYARGADDQRGRLRRSAAPILGYAVPAVVLLIWIALIAEMRTLGCGGDDPRHRVADSGRPERQVTPRHDPDLLARLRADGPE